MRKILSLTACLLSIALTTLSASGAKKVKTRSADEKPIITIKSNAYQEIGSSNNFGIILGATETDYFDIDCGYGMQELEVEPWGVQNGVITGTYKSLQVTEEGLIKIYGDASKIDMIQLQGGYITEIEMEDCVNLEVLDLSHNSLQKLDLTSFTNLLAIYLSDNPFTKETPLKIGAPKNSLAILEIDIVDHLDQSFNLSDYPAMQAFDAYHNLDLWNLDPTGCPELLTMSLELTNVSSLDVSKNPKLMSLNISETRIGTIDLSNNSNLKNLLAEHASGTVNVGYKMSNIDLSPLTALELLYLGGNELESIDLSKNTKLATLNLKKNNLTSLDLSANKNLYSINVSANNMDFATLPAPQDTWGEYYYEQNNITVPKSIAVDTPINLSSKVLRPGTETSVIVWQKMVDGNDTIIDSSLYKYADGVLTFNQALADSVYVRYHNSLLNEYALSTTPFMVKLPENIGKPSAVATFSPKEGIFSASIGLYGADATHPKKFMVDFGDGVLKDFTATSAAEALSPNVAGTVPEGKEVTIYVPEEEAITSIAIHDVSLNSINLQNAATLRNLTINGAELESVDLRYNRCLESLNLDNNNLSALDLAGIYPNWDKHVLSDISAAYNRINEINITSTQNLYSLNLSHNQLTEISLKNFDNLKHLDLSSNELNEEISLVYLALAETINLSDNNLKRVVYDTFSNLKYFNLTNNKFTIETLPYQPGAEQYLYAPQKQLTILRKAPAVNLSEQNRILVDGKGTDFVWKKTDGSLLIEGTDIICNNGATRFLNENLGTVYCEMTNPAFPAFEGENVFRTTDVTVVSAPTNVVASFTTTQDSNDGEFIIASNTDTALYFDWRGDGSEFIPYEAPKEADYVDYTDIRTYKNANVKVYTYDSPEDISVFSLYNIEMSNFDGSPLKYLKSLSLGGTGLEKENLKLPDADLSELSLWGAALDEYIWKEKYPNLVLLNLSENKLTSFDASGLLKLQVLHLNYNQLTDVKFNNPVLWELGVSNNELETIDLSGLKKPEQIHLFGNKLSELNVLKFRAYLRVLDISENRFTFATMPVPTDYPRMTAYRYNNQAYVDAVVSDDFMTYDLSSQAMVKNMYETTYTWFLGEPVYDAENGTLSGETLLVDDEYTIENGISTFSEKFPDDVVCVMTNNLFPQTYLRTPPYRVGYDSGVNDIVEQDTQLVDVYTLSGMIVKHAVESDHALDNLTTGIYIVNGKKVFVK